MFSLPLRMGVKCMCVWVRFFFLNILVWISASFFTFRNNSSCHFVLNLPYHNWLRRNVDVFVQKIANILFFKMNSSFPSFLSHNVSVYVYVCVCACVYLLILFTHILRRSMNNECTNNKKDTYAYIFRSPHSCALFFCFPYQIASKENQQDTMCVFCV